ncbi:MAG: amidohydrolase family protein [Eubacteriaceae bacterium]
MNNSFAIHGDLVWNTAPDKLESREDGWLVCLNGRVEGVFQELPEKYQNLEQKRYPGKLIIPGLCDLHLHAPQFAFRGTGMDLELLDWLDTFTFPEEARFADTDYALKIYTAFTEYMRKSPTTRLCVFGTVHGKADLMLARLLDQAGLRGFVGKVSMDRNAPESLLETDPVQDLEDWIDQAQALSGHIRPVLTPRFLPSCSDSLMEAIGRFQKEYGLPLQSHLSENPNEIKWVAELCPQSSGYADAYRRSGTLGANGPCVMAHCVWLTDEEIGLLKTEGTYIAHCPQSNMDLSSGIAPVRKFMENGLRVGLGTDIGAGFSPDVFRAMADAVMVSKLRWRMTEGAEKPLTTAESFYLGTKGGGSFFGKTGSFEKGYECDLLVIDDQSLQEIRPMQPSDRLERLIYLSPECHILEKYVCGKAVYSADER